MPDGGEAGDGAGVADVMGGDCVGDGVATEATSPVPVPGADAEPVDEESAAGVDVVAGTVIVLLETVLVIGSDPPPQLARATIQAVRKRDMHLDG